MNNRMSILPTAILWSAIATIALPDTFTVTNTSDGGSGSLRQAIIDANGNAGTDTIAFNIPAADSNCNTTTHVCTITPTAAFPLPFITGRVTIDGYSQPGASVNTLANGDDAVLLIELDGSDPNAGPGLVLQGAASGSVIRGLVVDHGWNFSILVQTDTVAVEGCFIGIDPSGLVARPNSNGVFADFNTPTSGMRIGGTSPGLRNVISGNGAGIYFQSGANHVVQGNFIGTNRNGTAAVPNGTAIQVQQSDDVLIGGTTAQERNIIANVTGIVVTVAARTRIQGNFIGTDVTGTVALGNHFNTAVDVDFAASATQIGGLTSTPGMPPGNVISGSGTGLQVGVGANNVINTAVMGNLIGTDASGTNALGNLTGITISDPSNTVGGTDPMARNVISGNGVRGILLQSQNNQVQGNFIGTDITGTQLLGNGGDGVLAQTSNNTIGGVSGQLPGNLIAGNGGRGVEINSTIATGIAIVGNSIHSNGSLGIDLSGDGVTDNDHCDADTGSNNLQNYPVITSALSSGGSTTVQGSLDSTANTTFRIEFFSSAACDPSGNGEGQTFLGFTTVTTNGTCTANIDATLPVVVAGGAVVTATTTDPNGNTSEFSGCQQVNGGPTPTPTPPPTPTPTPAATPGQLLNISTRLRVQTGENVLIGGFIITGTDPKRVIVRAIGPSLAQFFSDFLADPTLELHGPGGFVTLTNDNWKIRSDGSSQQAEIEATSIPPANDLESALVQTLPANNAGYTAIVRGKDGTTGIGLVEAYDLDTAATSKLANISTRGFVETGNNVLIGGFIAGNGLTKVIIRAIGPSLGNSGIAGALQDPTLELHDGSGALIASDDNWRTGGQEAEIIATTIPPTNDLESAIVATLVPGPYTAIVGGKDSTTGVGLVEVYNVQ